jgi:hypothetical protein
LLIFGAAMVAFHLANAAMLPLVGQVLALQNKDVDTALMSTCIVAAQLVMVPTAYLAGEGGQLGSKTDLSGWIRLPHRARLSLHAVRQPLLAGRRADSRRCRSGDFRRAVPARRAGPDAWDGAVQRQPGGALTTAWGVGAALSNIIAGRIVVAAGYDAAFISLGILAAVGLALYAAAMPETGPDAATNGGLTQAGGLPRTGETRG